MKTFIKLVALGALAGVVFAGISVSAAESSEQKVDGVDFSLIGSAMPSEVLEKMEAKTFESSDGTVLPYRIYYSPAYKAEDGNAMLFVFLHGAGGVGSDNEKQIRDQLATVNYLVSDSADAALSNVPYIVIAPQCPEGTQWVNTPYKNGSYSVDEVAISAPLNAVYELIQKTVNDGDADSGNVMLGGISMGGYGTWDLALRHPEAFNAIFPICGGGDPTKAASLADLKVWTFHSDNDASVPVQGTRDMVAALEKAEVDVKYTEFSGKGHNAWYPAMTEVTDPYLLEWLFEECRTYKVKLTAIEGDSELLTEERLRKGDLFNIEIEPTLGYVAESLFVNGEETEFVLDDKGTLYCECTVTGDMDIDATFVAAFTEESAEDSTEESADGIADGTAKDNKLSTPIKVGIAAGIAALVGACIGIIAVNKKKKQ